LKITKIVHLIRSGS